MRAMSSSPPSPAADLPDRPRPDLAPADAAVVDPALLAAVAADPAPGRPWKAVAVFAAIFLALSGAIAGMSALARKRNPTWSDGTPAFDDSVYLPALSTERLGPDEERADFTGFALSIDTVPSGAVVTVAGEVRGEAPVLTDFRCRTGQKLELLAEKPGYRRARRIVTCRVNTVLKLTLHLER